MRRFPEPTTERCFLKMDSHAWTGAAELAAAIRSKELSPVELMDAVLARIDARNPGINALIYVAYDHARLAARKAEDDVMSQRTLGPLHGVPTAIKDLFDSKPGWPYTLGGIRALSDRPGTRLICRAIRVARQVGARRPSRTASCLSQRVRMAVGQTGYLPPGAESMASSSRGVVVRSSRARTGSSVQHRT